MKKYIKFIIPILIVVAIILFMVFSNPLPKGTTLPINKFHSNLKGITKAEITMTIPYDEDEHKLRNIVDDETLKDIKESLKRITISSNEATYTSEEDGNFYYKIVLYKNEDTVGKVFFRRNLFAINNKKATIIEDDFIKLNGIVKKVAEGYGYLTCSKETKKESTIERYYFADYKLYYYNLSKTYLTNEDITKDLEKINEYNGITAAGNTIGNDKYSYTKGAKLKEVSSKDFEEVFGQKKEDFEKQTLEEIKESKKDMNCTFTLFGEKDD